ncbi:hypothetical protein [Pseudogulbenkiania subflava]|uniref:Uncharacterized protein n=1 Tax=Pseudogulbenkiania subflava DSM 22618 TaxID=1123014 RepID=A0A1Y6C8W7_9NEIS|nr:hypothetical protein [Pseudogulbenkiania subflava]SMF42988.1 hypothetical protein SAMN02745746_03205 [Pseudogulbenkiania subflava DSM 22618]
MKTWQKTLAASLIAAFLSPLAHAELSSSPKISQTQVALRDLWSGHIFWVRNVALETLAHDKSGAAAAEQEVVANAKQIAASIQPFYGQAASDKLFTLLAGHYGAVKQYLIATGKGSKSGQDSANKAMAANVDEIAAFLSSANPYLPKETLQGLLLAHGGHHVQQIQELKDKDYRQEAHTWEAMKQHMNVIADALGGALAKQFPERF